MGGATFVALVAIEAGQIFLPDRIADLTDAFVGQAGVALGFWLGSIAGAARSDEVTV
jgi:VanZ family protein